MSVRRTVEFDGDDLVVRERRQLDLADLFDEDGRLVVHQDGDRWEGYRREQIDGDVRYIHHDDRRRENHPFGVEVLLGDEAVRNHVRRLIEEGRLDPATLGGESE
jgi:hypothetical protein